MTSEPFNFFGRPTADVILRSSDGVDFGVHKLLLSEASPFFETMFSLPQSSLKEVSNDSPVPVIPVTEHSMTLNILLQICYPIPDPALESLEDVANTMAAALKYEIEVARLLCTNRLLSPDLLERDPVGVYAVATSLRLEDEARIAAKNTLRHPFPPSGDVPGALDRISGRSLYRLFEYRENCKQAVLPLFIDRTRLATHSRMNWLSINDVACHYECTSCIESEDGIKAFRIDTPAYRDRVATLLAVRPCGEAVANDSVLQSFTMVKRITHEAFCSSCVTNISSNLHRRCQTLGRHIDELIDKVSLVIEF